MMELLNIALSYAKEAYRFFRSPRAFIREFDARGAGQGKTSVGYTVFAFILTSAFVLVELRLIPREMAGPFPSAIKKDELIFSYWVLILVFALFTHAACRVLSGRATFRASLIGILRIYSFLVPATTLLMILSSQLIGFAVSTYWLVIPPLGVMGFEPFVPTTGNLLLVAAFMTVYFYLALFFLLCTVWMLGATHQLLYGRTCIAAATGIGALFLVQPFIIRGVRKVYELFEPLLTPFLGP